MRENRMLRLTWRGLETESRSERTRARHARKGEYGRSRDLRITAPALDPTYTFLREFSPLGCALGAGIWLIRCLFGVIESVRLT